MKMYKCSICGSHDLSIITTIKQGDYKSFDEAIRSAKKISIRCNKCNLFVKAVEDTDDIIPSNTYKKREVPNPLAVKGICEAFLSKCAWSIFHPVTDGRFRYKHCYIRKHKRDDKYFGFCDNDEDRTSHDYIRIYDCDVKEAFKVLIDKGYYIFRVYEYGSWLGYRVSEKPYMQNGVSVSSFEGSID